MRVLTTVSTVFLVNIYQVQDVLINEADKSLVLRRVYILVLVGEMRNSWRNTYYPVRQEKNTTRNSEAAWRTTAMAGESGIWGQRASSFLDRVVRAGHSEEVTLEERAQWKEEPCQGLGEQQVLQSSWVAASVACLEARRRQVKPVAWEAENGRTEAGARLCRACEEFGSHWRVLNDYIYSGFKITDL